MYALTTMIGYTEILPVNLATTEDNRLILQRDVVSQDINFKNVYTTYSGCSGKEASGSMCLFREVQRTLLH